MWGWAGVVPRAGERTRREREQENENKIEKYWRLGLSLYRYMIPAAFIFPVLILLQHGKFLLLKTGIICQSTGPLQHLEKNAYAQTQGL